LPSLSFTRDHRGYEYTAVVHAGRRNNPDEQRILYWFRTPPGVRFGRVPIDEDVIRSLEEHNPGLVFDWDKILKAPPAPRRAPADIRAGARKGRREAPLPAGDLGTASPPSPPSPVVAAKGGPDTADTQRQSTPGKRQKRRRGGARGEMTPAVPASSAQLPELVEDHTSFCEGTGDEAAREPGMSDTERDLEALPGLDDEDRSEVLDVVRDDPRAVVTAAGAALGPEGLARLRTRCAELKARITERITDVERADTLRDQAARLDPDAWVTAQDVRDGLEHYEAVYQELRQALGPEPSSRRGRRRRRASPPNTPGGSSAPSGSSGRDGPARPEPGDSTS
jgi:hypothetical protein